MAISEIWQWLGLPTDVTSILIQVTIIIIVKYIFNYLKSDENWEKYGVKEAALAKEITLDMRILVHKLIAEHGDIVGTRSGGMNLYTTNMELLKMILVKDVNNFADKPILVFTGSNVTKNLYFLTGNDWKRVHQVIAPLFSSEKIKNFVPIINHSATKLTKVMVDHAKREKPVVIKDLAVLYTTELRARLAFGLHADCIGKKDGYNTAFWQLANLSVVDISGQDCPGTITDDELYGHALSFISNGIENTSTALQFCLYLLAKHPDVQERLFDEITSIVKSEEPTFEELEKLKYADQVISESLRLFSPDPMVTRKAAETRTYGKITIPKGTNVVIPYYLIMMDPKNYEDPEKFDPDRFTEETNAKRDPITFPPFGFGPRQCSGMRLALLELKIALVNLIRKVRFELDEKMKEEELNIILQGSLVKEKIIMLTVKLRDERK